MMDTLILSIILTKLLIISGNQNFMQIHDLNNNPGLLALNIGYGFLQIGEHKIFHVINLDTYEPIFKRLGIIINGLKSIDEFQDTVESLDMKYKNAHEIYAELLPRNSRKRGILNFIGTGIKQITGNLDNDDLTLLNNDINQLQIDNKMLIIQNNEQVKINIQFQDRINTLIKEFNKQQDEITKGIIAARTNSSNRNFNFFKEIFKLNLNLDRLLLHLRDIHETIQLARLNIISERILSLEELNFANTKLEEQGVGIVNIEKYLRVFRLESIILPIKVNIYYYSPFHRKISILPYFSRFSTSRECNVKITQS
ncbi:uncharacterized protein LOC131694275 [Topomyia yanbarensis]|uniref:uncharacterized protein LOC131694275 n=1 Tax=Topomyia yanbarensis TaxID=2498891 RepID=UPI00273C561F|nr:uncharacterized protein LOC131694275 [Topomyia yanbarensis]